MKWIKLFESFGNLENKIKFVNDAYYYFKIMLSLKKMNLQKFETKANIYFYTTSLGKKILMFVYCKENRYKILSKTLIYSLDRRYELLLDASNESGDSQEVHQFKFSNYTNMVEVYEKVLDEFFSEYTKGSRKKTLKKIAAFSYDTHNGFKWQIFVNAFRKLKGYKS